MKALLPLSVLAALAACGPAPEQSVANRYEQTEQAIRNTAASYETRVANDLAATERSLDTQANAALANLANAAASNEALANEALANEAAPAAR